MSMTWHDQGLYQWFNGTIDANDTYRVMFLLDGHTPSNTDVYVDDIVADEITETYTHPTLSSVAVSVEAGRIKLDAADIQNSVTLGDAELISHVAVYKVNTGDGSDDVLLATVEGQPKYSGDGSGGNADFPVIWNGFGFGNLLTT